MESSIASDVRVALCETNSILRGAFQTALFRRGLRDIEICRDSGALLSFLDLQIVDLVICSSDLPGIEFPYLVQQIRRQTVGRNPFTVILATVGDSTLPQVRSLINAGVDRVARKPISMGDLLGHVNSLISTRKPFVATEDYLGPSRRAAVRPDSGDGELMDVPNTLRTKLVGRETIGDIDQLIEDSMSGLRQISEQNNCWAVWRSVRRIAELAQKPDLGPRARAELSRLQAMSLAVGAHLEARNHEHFGQIARCLVQLVDLLRSLPAAEAGQVAVVVSLMERLGEVIRQAGQCDARAISQVGQIAAAVNQYVRQAAVPAAGIL